MRIQDIPQVAADPAFTVPVATFVGSFKRLGSETKFGPEVVFTVGSSYASEVLRIAESRGRMVQIQITTTERGARAQREPSHVDGDGNIVDIGQWLADLESVGLGDLLDNSPRDINDAGVAATPADEVAASTRRKKS